MSKNLESYEDMIARAIADGDISTTPDDSWTPLDYLRGYKDRELTDEEREIIQRWLADQYELLKNDPDVDSRMDS